MINEKKFNLITKFVICNNYSINQISKTKFKFFLLICVIKCVYTLFFKINVFIHDQRSSFSLSIYVIQNK